MDSILSIRPSRELRNNYAQVSALCREHPVAITVNGREDVVLTDHAWFMRQQQYIAGLEEQLAFYAHLSQAEDDRQLGRTYTENEVFSELLSEIDKL